MKLEADFSIYKISISCREHCFGQEENIGLLLYIPKVNLETYQQSNNLICFNRSMRYFYINIKLSIAI